MTTPDQIGEVTHTLIRDEPPTMVEMDACRVDAMAALITSQFPWTRLEIIVIRHPLGVVGPLFPVRTDEPCWTVAWSAWTREPSSLRPIDL